MMKRRIVVTAVVFVALVALVGFNILCPDEEHVIEGVGRMTPLERPEEVNAIIESFLRRFAPAAIFSGIGVPIAEKVEATL